MCDRKRKEDNQTIVWIEIEISAQSFVIYVAQQLKMVKRGISQAKRSTHCEKNLSVPVN